jgi:hypothetical protein
MRVPTSERPWTSIISTPNTRRPRPSEFYRFGAAQASKRVAQLNREKNEALPLSATTDFIVELVRAAIELGTLSIAERRRLVDRAVRMVRELRMETGVRPGRRGQDPLRDIEIAALIAEVSGTIDDVKNVRRSGVSCRGVAETDVPNPADVLIGGKFTAFYPFGSVDSLGQATKLIDRRSERRVGTCSAL